MKVYTNETLTLGQLALVQRRNVELLLFSRLPIEILALSDI